MYDWAQVVDCNLVQFNKRL